MTDPPATMTDPPATMADPPATLRRSKRHRRGPVPQVKSNATVFQLQAGLPLAWTSGDPKDLHDLQCFICHELAREPYGFTRCQHPFCKSCLESYIAAQRHDVVCPVCRAEGKMIELPFVARLVNKLPTTCPLGCGWQGAFSDLLKTHATVCPEKAAPCPHCEVVFLTKDLADHVTVCDKLPMPCMKCQQLVWREVMPKHITQMCPERRLKCEVCRATVVAKRMEEHRELECRSHRCPHGCAGRFTKVDLRSHLKDVCPHEAHPCPYHRLGCTEQRTPADLQGHLEQNVAFHADLVARKAVTFGDYVDLINKNTMLLSLMDIPEALYRLIEKGPDYEHYVEDWLHKYRRYAGNVCTVAGKRVLVLAHSFPNTRKMELHLKAGAAVDVTDARGDTALHWAAYRGDVEKVKLLCQYGSPINAHNSSDRTPLREMLNAVLNTDTTVKLFKLLVELGASLDFRWQALVIPSVCEELTAWLAERQAHPAG